LGLAGRAGSGKDTVADYLVKRYGFLKFSFSDALYREVAAAFGLEDESLLRDRATKEAPYYRLQHTYCMDDPFRAMLIDRFGDRTCSPREILQWWGTEYRRAQDPEYWIKQADAWIFDVWAACAYPEHRPQFFVNTSVRFPNERAWVHRFTNGQVWHLRREGLAAVTAHESEVPLEVLHNRELVRADGSTKHCFERALHNNGSIDSLYRAIELLLATQAPTVRAEPMLPYEPPAETGPRATTLTE
jgi:hypothetical protein